MTSSASAGGLVAQLATADALLHGFAVTGRIPYIMLAEELVLVARRRWWREPAGGFESGADESARSPLSVERLAVSVLCRLAQGVAGAVWRASDDGAGGYRDDAAHLLVQMQQHPESAGGPGRAAYGLALAEWLERS
jgi:hypothetical protein